MLSGWPAVIRINQLIRYVVHTACMGLRAIHVCEVGLGVSR